jgi:thiol-disulfide isomerase/thioredoxin
MSYGGRALALVVMGVLVLCGVLVVVAVVGLARRRFDGRLRAVTSDPGQAATGQPVAEQPASPELAALTGLGYRTDEADVTFVQFSSAFCQPCRATRAVLADVAATLDGVRHLEVDAESQLDAVRTLGILRTPTTLVVDRDGAIVQRASGQPRKADVIAAVGKIVLSKDGVRVSDGETS